VATPSQPPKPEPAILDLRTALDWEQWLEQHADETPEGVWLRLLNKNAPEARFSYVEAVEIALCFGWIDGQARKYDEISRLQKFTPRRVRSAWSTSNTERATRLIAAGRMRPSGQRAIDAAKADGRWQQAAD
jgi:uncharacterized protein YdeI (YjbR/CyaY-like superfamily)